MHIQTGVSLKDYSTMRIGGTAKALVTITSKDELVEVLQWAAAKKLPHLVLGGGSNIIFSAGYEGLVVKEKSNSWSLPGGGWDNGESQHNALKRELYEEIKLESPFAEKIVGLESMYVKEKRAWLLWLVFELVIDVENMKYGVGADADEVAFIDPAIFHDSSYRSEKLVHKFTCVSRQ